MNKFDVIIVGCGPVGAIIANLLGSKGLDVCIIDKEVSIYNKPRAIVLDWEAMRALQYCNVAHKLKSSIIPHTGTDYLGVENELIKLFDPQPPPYALGWPSTIMFVQPILEKLLRQSFAKKKNVKFFSGFEVVDLHEDKTGVKVEIKSVNNPKKTSLESNYLIGCDGANSTVRSKINIGMEDHKFDESWIVVDAHLIKKTKLPKKTTQYCWPSRPATFVVGPGKLRRWEIKILPNEKRSKFNSEENVLEVLKNYVDVKALNIWRSSTYHHKVVVAKQWQKGKVFLAGDAAHQTPPFLGQGLCTGIRDAFNLSWKIIHLFKYNLRVSALNSYQQERKPHATKVIKHAKEFGLIIGEMDIEKAKLRDKKLRAQLINGKMETTRQKFIPDLGSGVLYKKNSLFNHLVGGLFVQPMVKNLKSKETLLDDILPMKFLYVTSDFNEQKWMDQFHNEWSKIGGLRVNIKKESHKNNNNIHRSIINLEETDGFFSKWKTENNVVAVIVRPDRYIFGVINSQNDLENNIKQINKFFIRKT